LTIFANLWSLGVFALCMTFRVRIRKVDCDSTRGSVGFSKFVSPDEGKNSIVARINANKFTMTLSLLKVTLYSFISHFKVNLKGYVGGGTRSGKF